MIEQTKNTIAKMKLNGMLKAVDVRLHEANTNGWGHMEFLSALITDEQMHRNAQATQRRIKGAHFRSEACLEKIDFTAKRNLTRPLVQNLMTLQFMKDPRNILIFGATGVGKTFLASAIGHHACRQGSTCAFLGMNMFIEKLTMGRADGTFLRIRDRLIKVDLLILDDLGIKPLTGSVTQDLYDILEERYQTKPTIITSQLPLTNWSEVIDDPVALEAILDRLIHGAINITVQGESYRKKRGAQTTLDKPS